MNLPALPKSLKNPYVIGAGVLVALIVVTLAMRKGTPASGASVAVASQGIASQTNVALAGYTNDYNKAALSYNALLAEVAAKNHATDVTAATTLELQSASTLDMLSRAAAQVGLINAQGAAAVMVNSEAHGAYLDAQELNSRTMITLSPHIEALAKINADAGVSRAGIAASMATTIASINAAVANKQTNAHTTDSLIRGLPGLLNSFDNIGLFDNMGSMFGGGGSSASSLGDMGNFGEVASIAA